MSDVRLGPPTLSLSTRKRVLTGFIKYLVNTFLTNLFNPFQESAYDFSSNKGGV